MEKMTSPQDETASTLDAFRVFDGEGKGYISSKVLREVLEISLHDIPAEELKDLLEYSHLDEDRNIYYEVMIFVDSRMLQRSDYFRPMLPFYTP